MDFYVWQSQIEIDSVMYFEQITELISSCAMLCSIPNSVVPCWPSTAWHTVDVVHAQCTGTVILV